jgi:hypothetical protein
MIEQVYLTLAFLVDVCLQAVAPDLARPLGE